MPLPSSGFIQKYVLNFYFINSNSRTNTFIQYENLLCLYSFSEEYLAKGIKISVSGHF